MFGERGPSTSDPVLHFGGFLVHEGYHLSQVLFTFPPGGSISTCISPISVLLSLFALWLVRILVLLGWISKPRASALH